MDLRKELESKVKEEATDVVFRRIKGRVVPIKRRKNAPPQRQSTLERVGLNTARSGSFAISSGAAVYGLGMYAKKRIDWNISNVQKKLKKVRPLASKKPLFTHQKPLAPWTDDTPLAKISKATDSKYRKQMQAYSNAFEQHLYKLDKFQEARRQATNFKAQINTLRKYSNFISKKIGPTSIRAGLIGGALSLAYLTGAQLADSFRGKKK
jgi:hypothetical protein